MNHAQLSFGYQATDLHRRVVAPGVTETPLTKLRGGGQGWIADTGVFERMTIFRVYNELTTGGRAISAIIHDSELWRVLWEELTEAICIKLNNENNK